MKKIALSFSISFLLCIASIAQNTGKLSLKIGDKYVLENKVTIVSSQQLMGQSFDTNGDFFTLNNIEVKDSKNDIYTLSNTYKKITANMEGMGQNFKFDSDKKEDMEGQVGNGAKEIVNKPVDVLIDKNGKVIPGKTDSTSKKNEGDMLSMVMSQIMGDPQQTGYGLSGAFRIIPSKPAAAGLSWTDSSETEGLKNTTTYTIKEIKGNDAVISISAILNMNNKAEVQGMEVTNKSTGKITGEEIVEYKTGVIKQRNSTMESDGKIIAMGQEIPVTMKVNTITTVKSL